MMLRRRAYFSSFEAHSMVVTLLPFDKEGHVPMPFAANTSDGDSLLLDDGLTIVVVDSFDGFEILMARFFCHPAIAGAMTSIATPDLNSQLVEELAMSFSFLLPVPSRNATLRCQV